MASKATIEALGKARALRLDTFVRTGKDGRPEVAFAARAITGLARGSAPVHPWTAGGANFWLPEAYRMRHYIAGESRRPQGCNGVRGRREGTTRGVADSSRARIGV